MKIRMLALFSAMCLSAACLSGCGSVPSSLTDPVGSAAASSDGSISITLSMPHTAVTLWLDETHAVTAVGQSGDDFDPQQLIGQQAGPAVLFLLTAAKDQALLAYGDTIYVSAAGDDADRAAQMTDLALAVIDAFRQQTGFDLAGKRIDNTNATAVLLQNTVLARRASQAMADMYNTWWQGTPSGGNVVPTRNGFYSAWPAGGAMPWEAAQMMTDIYTLWLMKGRPAAGDEVDRFRAQWDWMAGHLGTRLTEQCGLDWPNSALDDTGTDAVLYMMTYDVTGDTAALAAVETILTNGFGTFKAALSGAADDTKNRSAANGLWYSQHPPSLGYDRLGDNLNDNRSKSLVAAYLVMTALEFFLIKSQTDAAWQITYTSLWNDTLGAYQWMEANLLRASAASVNAAGATGSAVTLPRTFAGGMQNGGDYTISAALADNLYWGSYNENLTGADPLWGYVPDEKVGPNGGSRGGLVIEEVHSFSSLYGNMAMAICHARLYQLTGEVQYLNRAVRTAWALTDSQNYNRNGVLLDDDAWGGGFAAGMYVGEVLTLPGIRNVDINMFLKTGQAAYDNCRFTLDASMAVAKANDPAYAGKVFYRAEWSGGTAWTPDADSFHQPTQLMTSGGTVNMIVAGAYAEELIV
ncbi:MAG: hypothetical protein FWF49_02640 [Oscillospiraceae bacterium]|nr:hypothetical protein [Oscillospiraceae bacterium]